MKSIRTIDLIKQFEGCKLSPYKCPAGIPTIGWGSTRYPNGVRVAMKDPKITIVKADEMLQYDLQAFEKDVTLLTSSVTLTQNQFDALVDFSYNCGSDIDIDTIPEGLGDSQLLKKVLANPNDPEIAKHFRSWVYACGKIQPGLLRRREAEVKLYFSK